MQIKILPASLYQFKFNILVFNVLKELFNYTVPLKKLQN